MGQSDFAAGAVDFQGEDGVTIGVTAFDFASLCVLIEFDVATGGGVFQPTVSAFIKFETILHAISDQLSLITLANHGHFFTICTKAHFERGFELTRRGILLAKRAVSETCITLDKLWCLAFFRRNAWAIIRNGDTDFATGHDIAVVNHLSHKIIRQGIVLTLCFIVFDCTV